MADTAGSVSVVESDPLLPEKEEGTVKKESSSTVIKSKSKIKIAKPNYKEIGASRMSENVKQVQTPYGLINITLQGDPQKPAILTYHDIGMNHYSCFSSFMSDPNMMQLLPLFYWVHIDAPGQEEGAESFSEHFVYPSVNELAEQVGLVIEHLELSYIIGFGVGAGANILTRYAILSPESVRGLILVNLSTDSLHWSDFSYLSDKLVGWLLKTNRLQDRVEKYLMSHSFSPNQYDPDLASTYHDYFQRQNPHNLSLFLESYSKRTTIFAHLSGETRCRWLFVMSGENDKASKSTLEFHHQLGPSKSTILELYESGHLVLEEHPDKVATSFRLFVQGLGHAVTLGVSKGTSNDKLDNMVLQGVSVVETKF